MRIANVTACIVMALGGVAFAGVSHSGHRAGSRTHFVAPGGVPDADGTSQHPWDLTTALGGARGKLQPGDTVWLRGGTYRGWFRTTLQGAPERPIVFRGIPGERATIDGTLRADGAWLVFWGFEITQSDPSTYGLQANTANGRFVNLIVHDAGTQGISFWTPAVDAELYGCIVYNNGTHENLDHGVYVHNETGTKRIEDNVFFNNLARGIQVYASPKNPALRNVVVRGNVVFDNGSISTKGARQNLIFNAQVPTEGMVGVENLLYFAGDRGVNIRLGHYAARNNKEIELRDNYVVGGDVGLEMLEPWDRAVVQGNEFAGARDLVRLGGGNLGARYQWDGNVYDRDSAAPAWVLDSVRYGLAEWRRATGLGRSDRVEGGLPKETRVFVRPNRYEAGRALVVVYNWAARAEVAVDVSSVLRTGDRYEVHNVQDLFGQPVTSGVYAGGAIAIPLTGVDAPRPVGRATPQPPRTGPAFDTFLLTVVAH